MNEQKNKKPRLSWRINAHTGRPRLYSNGKVLAYIYPKHINDTKTQGFYWAAGCEGLGIPSLNSMDSPVATLQEAKAAALAYVKEYLTR